MKDSRDQLIEDLKRVIDDAQNLAEEAKNASGAAIHDKMNAVQKDLGERMRAVREASCNVAAEAHHQADVLEKLIRRNPWRSITVAALAGVVIDRLFPR